MVPARDTGAGNGSPRMVVCGRASSACNTVETFATDDGEKGGRGAGGGPVAMSLVSPPPRPLPRRGRLPGGGVHGGLQLRPVAPLASLPEHRNPP